MVRWSGFRSALSVLFAASVYSLALPSTVVQAQFVCGGSTNGAAPVNGGGSTAVAGSVACGTNVNASGTNSFAAGNGAGGAVQSQGTRSVAIGVGDFFFNTSSGGTESVAIGYGAQTGGSFSIAIGSLASSGDGANNTAINGFINPGYANTNVVGGLANGSNTVVFGGQAGGNGVANNAVAIGQNAQIKGDGTTAVGQGSSALFAGSAAFGQGATTTRDNQQVFGTATNTYTMPGITSAASKTAQGAPTQIVTTNNNGDLASQTFAQLGLATSGDIAGINTQITTINGQITGINNQLGVINSQLQDHDARIRKANEGVAMAFAMAGVPTVLPHETVAFTANWGNFEGENGFSASGAMKLSPNLQLNGGVATGTSGNTFGSRVGVRIGW